MEKNMKPIIIANDKEHLKKLIKAEIDSNGVRCDLNHIDVSQVTDMSDFFSHSEFNGNISDWNVSNVTKMDFMFEQSKFNGDISKWDVSRVTNMRCMFTHSYFNQDISQWDVSKVDNMQLLFYKSLFNQDLSNWTPYSLSKSRNMEDTFSDSQTVIPYWYNDDNQQNRNKAITAYQLKKEIVKELNEELNISNNQEKDKKLKI
jgi:surface protein